MASVVYLLCAATALGCAVLLLRGYARSKARLLFWSGMCFVGLTINNVILVVDLLVLPQVDLLFWRTLSGLVGVTVLLVGLVWESK